jgi:hypothetical protein
VFVSDDGLSDGWRQRISKAGARLIIADVPSVDADGPMPTLPSRNRPA